MQCPQCNAQLDEDAVFCGNCGKQIVPLRAKGATVSVEDARHAGNEITQVNTKYGTQGQAVKPATPLTPGQYDTVLEAPPSAPRPPRGNIGRIALIVVVLLIIIAGGTIGAVVLLRHGNTPAPATGATGAVRFIDSPNSQGHTDALQITINGLAAPAGGAQYDAWLVNEQSEQIVPLGTLVANGQSFTLNHQGNGTNLLGLGNKLEITLEQGKVNAPTGQVILSGTFPPKAFIHIRHLLFSFPITPGKVGLLVGLLNQAQLLSAQAQLLQSVAAGHNTTGVQCVAQTMLDIIDGRQSPRYKALAPSCASQHVRQVDDGFGLLGNGYLALAAAHASLAATQPDATPNIRLHAGHVEIAITNIKGWVTTIEQDSLTLLAHPANTAKVQEIVTLSGHAYQGVDINGDESVDPVPGEAGAVTAYLHGQLMAVLPLAPASS